MPFTPCCSERWLVGWYSGTPVRVTLRFELSNEQVAALKDGAELTAGIDHENYKVKISPVADNIRLSLLGDID